MQTITTPNASATQTEHPWRATVRTLIQTALAAAVTILGILLFTPGALDELAAALGELGVVVPAALLALPPVIARVMAIPGIERALRGIGLGAAPSETQRPDAADESDVIEYEPDEIEGDDDPEVDVELTDDEIAALHEPDLTPPPAGYEPRH